VRIPFYLALPASLLAFPSTLPWVILFWIAVHSTLAFLRRPCWLPLVIAAAVILVKRVGGPLELHLLTVLLLGFAAVELTAKYRRPPKRPWLNPVLYLALLLALWLSFLIHATADVHRSRPLQLQPDRPIAVIGDSLSVHGWAQRIARDLAAPAVDRSEGGINTIEGLAKLPEVLSHRPQLVILELGGHDYLESRGRDATRANLDKMIRDVRGAGAEILLFEIPRGFVTDPFGGLERELAREHDLELVTDGAIRQLVLFSPFTPLGSWTGRKLSDDGLHPNEDGHRFLAERVKASLLRLYGTRILAAPR
jgi:lysophospholipase L1-like esterase